MASQQPFHTVKNLSFEQETLWITVDHQTYRCELQKVSPELANTTPEYRKLFEISASGYGIHWPLLDLDLSVDGILKVAEPHQKSEAA